MSYHYDHWSDLDLFTFQSSDKGYARALMELSDDRLDEVSAQLSSTPTLLAAGLSRYPIAIATWGRLRPEALDAGLLRLAEDLLSPSPKHQQREAAAALCRWQEVRPMREGPTPIVLLARGFGDHLKAEAGDSKSTNGAAPDGFSLLFGLIARCGEYGAGLEESGHRRRLRQHVDQHPDQWVTALPWLLQAAGGRMIIALGTIWAQQSGEDPLPVLRMASTFHVEPLATRALGLIDLLEGEHDTDVVLSRIATRLDRGRPSFPRPLAEPTSTWLSDLGLETELRSAIERAATDFANEFQTQGMAEEEGHVASLLTRIEIELRTTAAVRKLDGSGRPPADVTGSFRRLAKSEEAHVHADLALTVDIDVVGELKTTFTELVQVKKVGRPRTGRRRDSWRVNIDQLGELLRISPTSVYWLICVDGSILVVPAKLLLAIVRGQHVDDQGTFTLHYTAVRHAAVTLPSHLIDLTVGGWLGSDDEKAVARGVGASTTTQARALFHLIIRSNQG